MNGPRNIAGPVVRGTDLWGRDSDIAQLWKLLENGSVLLTGPRRHGKSSLMYALHDNPSKGFNVILLDIEWVETPEEFLTTMAAELLANDRIRQVVKNLKSIPGLLKKWVGNTIDEVGVGVGSVGELKIRLRSQLLDANDWHTLAVQPLPYSPATPLRGTGRPCKSCTRLPMHWKQINRAIGKCSRHSRLHPGRP
jgi:hypothetical protein